jgi:hypothetical protein
MADTPKLTLPEISTSQSSKEVTHNAGLWILDALVQPSIEDKDLTAPPGSPTNGACYIVAAGATGDWAGEAGHIAQYQATAWVFYTPAEGWKVYVRDENTTYYYNGSAWAEDTGGSQPYDIGGFVAGVPTANQVMLRVPIPRAVVFPANLTASRGAAGKAGTAKTDFDIQKNGASFGTMRFAGAGTTATFISAAGATFAAGDVLKIVAPASPDATLADVGFILTGAR